MKPTLNLREIEAFRSVMVTGSVLGAAKLMNVTQPGVSRTIGLLESRLGFSLFERRGRGIAPTPEAEALYREIEHIYGGIERVAQVAQDIRFQRAGALRVAMAPALAQWLVPRGIARFLSLRPKVTVFVQSLPSRQIAGLVSTRQFDVGIVELPQSQPAIEIEPFEPAQSVAVIPSNHSLASRRRISLKELDGERMVLLSQHSFIRYQLDDAFSSLGVTPNVVLETPTSSIACALVAAGAGITIVSRWAAIPFSSLAAVCPIKEAITSRHAIIFPNGNRSSLADAFANDLREEVRLAGRD